MANRRDDEDLGGDGRGGIAGEEQGELLLGFIQHSLTPTHSFTKELSKPKERRPQANR
jgi:hypothetical protein